MLDLSVISQIRLVGARSGKPLFHRLLGVFTDDSQQRLSDLQRGVAETDLQLIAEVAHALKSSAANIGAVALSEECRLMEASAREGCTANYESMLTEIGCQVRLAIEALQDLDQAEYAVTSPVKEGQVNG